MKLKFILTQNTTLKEENLLDQIIQVLKFDIIHGKLSQIWLTNDKEKEFIMINNDKDKNYIQININNNMGKILLTKIMCFTIQREKNQPFFIILTKDDINIRKILFNFNKNICNIKLFKILMRSFIIITQQQYIMIRNY